MRSFLPAPKKCIGLLLLLSLCIVLPLYSQPNAIPLPQGPETAYTIALKKFQQGFYVEALPLFKECAAHFRESKSQIYLSSVYYLGLCNTRIGNYGLCYLSNEMGIGEARRIGNVGMEYYFNYSEGINQWYVGNYTNAIKKLTATQPYLAQKRDFFSESLAYLYLGKSYLSLQQKEMALYYFKKVDALFVKHGHIHPDLREAYEQLIDYYKQNDDAVRQLFYIRQLVKADRILKAHYPYLLEKTAKKYNASALLMLGEDIEREQLLRRALFIMILLLVVAAGFYIYWRFRKKKAADTLTRRAAFRNIRNSIPRDPITDILPEVEAEILKKLEQFEGSKKYLEQSMTVARMAQLLDTNTKYVTRIIAKYRGKGTIDYISDLKIDHILTLLKTKSKYRSYTHEALGQEAGFGSTKIFTKAFKDRTGVSPNEFVQQLARGMG